MWCRKKSAVCYPYSSVSEIFAQREKEYTLSEQLLRSGTSIGANISEAEYSISKNDFMAKIYISFKECGETLYWLRVLYATQYLTDAQYQSMKKDCETLLKLLTSITKTLRTRQNK